jgi:predicted MFS family arabinose efflux permease
MFGTLANLWGRKRVLLGVLVAFVVGSAISGAAKNMSMLIAGRSEFILQYLIYQS